jgi:hypothetical protein
MYLCIIVICLILIIFSCKLCKWCEYPFARAYFPLPPADHVREYMSASTSGQYSHNKSINYISRDCMGQPGQTILETAGKSYANLPNDDKILTLLYEETMGIPNHPLPGTYDNCEFLNYNGYIYKEPCYL